MTINILIGIGGTGAKIVESALYLLSTGVGPQDGVTIGIVDQDNANGNVVRTENLLTLLQAVRSDFSSPRKNVIDWKAPEEQGGTGLFSIGVRPLFADRAHWRPAPDTKPTLRHILQHPEMSDEEKILFDLMFRGESASDADKEQTMELAEGYRGRAHVGAAALVSAINHDQPEFMAALLELLQKSSTGQDVRIFLAGSLFGGTGAAGFPTIARMLHKLRTPGSGAAIRDAKVKADKIHIGGALMLPYFSFAPPPEAEANVIAAAQLLPQARIAVEFYQNLQQQEKVFDRLYVSGWDRMFDLGYHRPGRAEQRNPALIPELVAALAAMDFFTLDSDEVKADSPMVAARRDDRMFGWDDLPANEALKKSLYEKLGGALRFALWWRYRVEPDVDDRGKVGGIFSGGWLKKLVGKDIDWEDETPQARKNLRDYCELILKWSSSSRLFSENVIHDFALWNGDRLLREADRKNPTDPVTLLEQRNETESLQDLSMLLHARDPNKPPVTSDVVFSDLNDAIAVGDSRGLGRLVAAVHRAARPFREEA
jgi:hypothetical protein